MKTLKEFNIDLISSETGEVLSNGLNDSQSDWLKQEAIKWLKKLRQSIKEGRGNFIIFADEYGDFIDGEAWIKHFFNIEGEELK